jgi:hypothetical protein
VVFLDDGILHTDYNLVEDFWILFQMDYGTPNTKKTFVTTSKHSYVDPCILLKQKKDRAGR